MQLETDFSLTLYRQLIIHFNYQAGEEAELITT